MHNGIDLPREGPHISGEQSQYQIGDTLNINCTSGKSHPSSSIQWFINDEPVSCLFNSKNIVEISYRCHVLLECHRRRHGRCHTLNAIYIFSMDPCFLMSFARFALKHFPVFISIFFFDLSEKVRTEYME